MYVIALLGFETNNKYTIKNSVGQKVFYAVEENDCCTRNCCGPMRPFEMKILDNFKNEVIHLSRPLACQSCFFPCCLQVKIFIKLIIINRLKVLFIVRKYCLLKLNIVYNLYLLYQTKL